MYDPAGSTIALPQSDINPPFQITRRLHKEAHHTHGVRLAPNGNWEEEVKFIKHKILRFNAKLQKHFLTTYESMVAMRTWFEPSIYYASGVTRFTPDQCEQLQKLAWPAWLRALGYSSIFPKAVAHAPNEFGGIAMAHMLIMQGVKGLEMMLVHLRACTKVRKMITIGLEYLQLIAGTSTCPYRNTQSNIAYEMADWFTSIQTFLGNTGSHLEIISPGYFLP